MFGLVGHHQPKFTSGEKYHYVTMSSSRLFQPLDVGKCQLQHRIVMAPMTRMRTDKNHAPLPITEEYYGQRSHTSGTLIITEGVAVSETLVGLPHWAGGWSQDQLQMWKRVADKVHSKSCFIFMQFCCAGRTADKGYPKLSSGDIPLEAHASQIDTDDDTRPPRAMTEEEIKVAIRDHATAARNAISAGFDGVELHGANGYLIDQFLQESCNNRNDQWGGSIEGRSRFALEVTKAVVEAIGAERVGFRISPWSTYHSIKPTNPEAQFSYTVARLRDLKLAYLHVVTSKVDNWADVDREKSLDFVFDNWSKEIPIIVTGGFNGGSAQEAVDKIYREFSCAIGFGRFFASTPDLVACIRKGVKPNPFKGELAYTPETPEGYIDYPALSE
jgi:NADPH2 dehydrogenase